MFFFRCPYNPRSCFSSSSFLLFIADVYFHLTLRFFMVYFCLLVVMFFSLSGFFSRISSSFFSSFCFSASPFSINCFLFARDVQQLFTILSSIYLFIYLLPQIYVINMMRAILLATFMPGVRQIHREDNSIVALPVNCVHLIDWWNTRNSVSKREREGVQGSGSTSEKNVCT